MATKSKFVRARTASIDADGGVYTLDYTLDDNHILELRKICISSDTNAICAEILFSTNGGSTWSNPWDTSAVVIIKAFVAAYIPIVGDLCDIWLNGGSNTKMRIKLTNNNSTQNASVFYILGGIEHEN